MLCTIYCKTIRSKKEKTSILDLEGLGARIRSDERRRRTVEAFRAAMPMPLPSMRWKDIELLPLVCPGLCQKKGRKGDVKTTYNGVVLLEVCDVKDEEAERIKARAATLPTTLAAFVGASGTSVKILVSGKLDNGTLPAWEDAAGGEDSQAGRFHKSLYEVSAAVYASIIGHPLKPKNAHADDTFRWTYDPTAFFNPEAQPIRIPRRDILRSAAGSNTEATANADAQEYGPGSTQPSPESHSFYRRRFALALSIARDHAAEEQHSTATEEPYQSTPPSPVVPPVPEGFPEGSPFPSLALLEATSLEALRLGIPQEEAVCQATRNLRFHDLDRDLVRTTVESIYLENAPKAGKNRSHGMQQLTYDLQKFMHERYDLRFNELTNGVEWRSNHSASFVFQTLDSRMINTMIQQAHECGLEVFDRDMKRYLGSTRVRNYNVARAYLNSLDERWDGKTDYIGALADRVPTSNPLWRNGFHTWFLGMVAQWNGWDAMHGNSVVPLLIGPQGCGKSTFGQLLLPPELREAGYRELVDFGSKGEVERYLTTSLLINLDEFNQIGEKIQQGFLKNLIQKTSVKGRRPYSNVTQNLPRFASFIATTNMTDVLSDPSGSRRFLVAEIKDGMRIDNTYPIYYTKIYAQAVAELEAGSPLHYFTPERVAELESYNTRYTENRTEIIRFLDTFELVTEPDEATLRMKLSDITVAVRQQTGYAYSDKAFNYLGRWLTNEAKAFRVRKTTANGSPAYLLRPRRK